MKIRNKSVTFYIFKAIKTVMNEIKGTAYDFGPSFNALMSRKSLDEVLTAMPGYKSGQTNYKRNYQVSLDRLKKRGFIKFSDKDQFTLTDGGRDVLVKFDIDAITLPEFEPQKWDGIWRVLIFDIPELTRAVRNLFRDKYRSSDFIPCKKACTLSQMIAKRK